MPSKTEKIRKRYIAFKIHAPRIVTRKEFIASMKKSTLGKKTWEEIKPWLTVFRDNEGILKCAHTGKDEAVELLTSIKFVGLENMPVKVETLGTSGTIKKAKRNYLEKVN